MINICLLGSSAMMPIPGRALTSAVLSCGGHTILFDCGEGTQCAARQAGVSLMKTELIALTHYHGDHIFGIPGMLQSFGVMGRTDPLYITGPAGISEALAPIFRLSGPLPYEVRLFEFPEGGIRLESWSGSMLLKNFRTNHRVESCGYRFELSRPGKFMVEKAEGLGIPKECWCRLQRGESVGVFMPEMVLGEERRGLSVVFTGDTSPSEEIIRSSIDADLMMCEATFPDSDAESAAEYGHCTVSQAASMASAAGAKRLWLVHFSQSIKQPEELLDEIKKIYPDAECGTDGKKITLKFEES